MLRTLQVARSGMRAQERKLEVLANNLANAATTGFRRVLANQMEAPRTAGGPGDLRPLEVTTTLDMRQGPLQQTGNPLDVAIAGDGFLVVQSPGGARYTRNGSLSVDPEGRLVNTSGYPVMGEGGAIQLPPGAASIAADGTIAVNGQPVDRIRVVTVPQARTMQPEGGGLLAARGNVTAQNLDPSEVRLMSGHLEGSNTNPVSDLIALITAQRTFEAGQRVLTATDESLRKTVSDIPRVG